MNRVSYIFHRIRWRWRKYIASVDWRINCLLLISLAVTGLHDFIFIGYPELFSYGGKIWDLIYALCLQLVASYVFYYIVVHLKRVQDKENLLPFISVSTNMIISYAEAVAGQLSQSADYHISSNYPTQKEVEDICAAVNPNDTIDWFPVGNAHGTHFQYLVYQMNLTKDIITSIIPLMPFLDSNYVNLLQYIDNCLYFSRLKYVDSRGGPSSQDFCFLASYLYYYLQQVKALKDLQK